MHSGMPYSNASETMPFIAARNPWFCIEQDVPLAREVRTGSDADGFLFLGDLDQPDVRRPSPLAAAAARATSQAAPRAM